MVTNNLEYQLQHNYIMATIMQYFNWLFYNSFQIV